MSKRFLGGMLAALVFAGVVVADDAASLRSQIDDLKAKVVAMDSVQMAPAGGGDAEALTSMHKNGMIKIGGTVKIDTIVTSRDDGDFTNGENDEVDSTTFYTDTAALNFEISASQDVSLNITLDLDDAWNGTDQDDLLEECYFLWKNVRCSNWTLAFGKKSVDYGLGASDMMTYSFLADKDEGVYWLGANEETDGTGNAHATVGSLGSIQGVQQTNLFTVEAQYAWCDFARVYMAVFQNNDSQRGMHEDRSDDHLGFQSWAVKGEITPLENLLLELSFINQHVDSFGDEDLYGTDAEEDTYSISFGVTYDFASVPLSVFAEYEHNWNAGYNEEADADVVSVGTVWGVTEALDLGLLVEWARIDDAAGYDEEDYVQVALNGTYTFDNGIYMMLEYAHVWYDADMTGGADADCDADMIGFRTGWEF